MKETLFDRLNSEIRDQSLFAKASGYGFDYLESISERKVYPTAAALDNLRQFDSPLPDEIGNPYEIIKLLNQYGSPATVSYTGGRYYGFVNGGIIPVGLAAKILSSFWDQNTAMNVLSPLSAKLESIVEKWLVELLDLPANSVAGFVSGTSMANLCGLAAARYRLLQKQGWDINEKGLQGAPKLRIVTSEDIHSTVLKAIAVLGFGKENIEWVPADDQGRIMAEHLPEIDGRTILILQAGNVHSGSFDDFNSICKDAYNSGAWIHIDGAFGLWAAATENFKYLTKGMQHAHSWAVDGHKTLNTPYDSGIILCSDKEALASAFHLSGDYLIKGDRDGMFFTPEMSRRARIIELWAILRYLGKEGIQLLIQGLHDRAAQFANEIRKVTGFEVLNEIVFNQVVVTCDTDHETELVIKKIQESRKCWVGGSSWKGRKVIRVSFCSWATTEKDVSITVDSFKEARLTTAS